MVDKMVSNKDFIIQKKSAIILAALVIIAGAVLYFGTGIYKNTDMASSRALAPVIDDNVLSLLKNVQLKAAYTDEGTIDMFALARNNDLAKLTTVQGDAIPEIHGMVLGNTEGSMMKKEGEFKGIGDSIEDYDLTFSVDGVLDNTSTFADDFHFINVEEYNSLKGDAGKLLIKFKDENTPKLFYLYDRNDPAPVKIVLSEGNMNLYYTHVIGKKLYAPLVLGYEEAKMMREEKLFANTGDTIEGFFGKDVIVVGIMQKTGTGMDMMHIVEPDFFEEAVSGVLV